MAGGRVEQGLQLVDRTEEQRAEQLPGGDPHAAVRVQEARFGGFLAQRAALDAGQFRHAVDEEQAGQHHAQFDGDGQVEQYGDEEGDEQDDPVVVRIAFQFHEFVPLAHVDGDDHDDGR
ncbi:hypothetical protein SDC9_186701 [bioreactor metagenome]|uniref:Uncharacterized protein n=1 Tax=bioreactor metagenome TaxID=1076179 RepID=A0A645HUX5_9ZZZZ